MASHASAAPYNSSHHYPISTQPKDGWEDSRRPGWNNPRRRSYPHLKDIKLAAVPEIERDQTLPAQLDKAERYIKSAQAAIEFHRADLAYLDYVRGYEVVVNYIPSHRDFGFYCDNNRAWDTRYKTLRRTIRDMESGIADVRSEIEADNVRSGTQPKSDRPGSVRRQSYDSGFGMPTNGLNSRDPSENSQVMANGESLPTYSQRAKPVPRPKPEALHSNRLSGPDNELTQRFARLRTSGGSSLSSVSMPDPADFQSGHSERSRPLSPLSPHQMNGLSPKPNGPRDMATTSNPPSVPPKILAVPPKIPLTGHMVSMPKAPSPTYSPVKVSQSSSQHFPSRPSGDYSHAHGERRALYYNQPNGSAQSIQLQRTRDENPYRPRTPNGVNSAIIAKSSSSEIPHEHAIDAATLFSHMKKYNVLLIDVRERERYDEGHIKSNTIICLEPVALREGVSAEDLEEAMIVSPEAELDLFQRRNEFDILVYYDERTSDTSFLAGRPTGSRAPALRALYDTLYEFNNYKPLKDGRPPALLLGGLDAWVDLLGTASLETSQTNVVQGSTRTRAPARPQRPPVRQRVGSQSSTMEVRRRRLRELKPLNEDEEHAWRQKAQQEEVGTKDFLQHREHEDDQNLEGGSPMSPHFADYEDFLRRFPDINPQESMTTAPRRPAPYQPPRYEPPPVPSLPVAPSRPPPAVPRPSYSGQAEIQSSQPALARVASATRTPLYTSTIRRKLPRTGLTNFGVTCYMNSTLQCLSGTIPMSDFFIGDKYKGYVQAKNWKGSHGIMPDLYTNVVRSLWKDDVSAVKPSTFRNFCGRMNREWVIDRQQDAKEFFDFLVDCLHEDLNVFWNGKPRTPLTPQEELERERTPIHRASRIEWEAFKARDYSYVSSLFAGQHASRLKCKTCGNTSTTYEAFYSISIEIPKSGQGDIYQCLRSYTSEESLSGDEVWNCPHCKCEREATKQIILTRLPQILVIHFKRFSASKTESARKIHTPIEFPLYNLTMDHFVIPRDHIEYKKEGGVDEAATAPYNYDAYGVLRHLGNTGNGGHYISMVKDPGRGCWRQFDDQRSTDFEPTKLSRRDALTNGEAYIVFYQRAMAR